MVSLENEYYSFKMELKNEKETLAKLEAIEIIEDDNNPFSTEERIKAKERGIKSCKETIAEIEEILAEVNEELIDFINNGGEVSQKTINELKSKF